MADESAVVVRFVNTTGTSAAKDLMQKAFKAVSSLGQCEWFLIDECLKIKSKERRFIYVFDEFAGEAFQHIVTLGSRVYGPTCILHCLKDSCVLPKVSHPVYCKAMEGIVVSCTNIIGEQRDALHQIVQWMMGEASKDFHERVTHLIAGEVGSKKYAVAARLGKAIMSPEWIDAVWHQCRYVTDRASESRFDSYRCPMFKGFVISVSGMDGEERANIRKLVEQNGGRYSGEMKINECTHLVLSVPKGQKYEFAVKWNINVVSPDWLRQSITAGYSLEEKLFPVSGQPAKADGIRLAAATSTPTNHDGHFTSLADVSCISTTHINDTAMSTCRDSSISASVLPSIIDPLEGLDVSRPAACKEPFLDGCKIFVGGITGSRLEKVRKIINRGGGTRYNQINDSVSHVIVNDVSDEVVKQIQASTYRPHVVRVHWLVECFKQGRRVDETNFRCVEFAPLPTASPQIDKSSKTSLRRPKAAGSSTATTAPDAANDSTLGGVDAEMNSLLSQYQPPAGSTTATLGESTLVRAAEMAGGDFDADVTLDVPRHSSASDFVRPAAPSSEQRPGNTSVRQEAPSADESRQNISMACDMDETRDVTANEPDVDDDPTLFKKSTFVLLGFNADESARNVLTDMITENGGVVVDQRKCKIADYGVVPVFGCEVHVSVTEVVTNAWLQMCVDEGQLVPIDSCEIFRPLTVVEGFEPLNGCVLSISGYVGIERDVLLQLAEYLGGTCQEYFVKRANRGLLPSTHLIVNAADGSKYNAAKKWKLPTVTKHWLLECARTGQRMKEEKFLVDNLPETSFSSSMNTSSAAAPAAAATAATASVATKTPDDPPTKNPDNLKSSTTRSVVDAADKKAVVTADSWLNNSFGKNTSNAPAPAEDVRRTRPQTAGGSPSVVRKMMRTSEPVSGTLENAIREAQAVDFDETMEEDLRSELKENKAENTAAFAVPTTTAVLRSEASETTRKSVVVSAAAAARSLRVQELIEDDRGLPRVASPNTKTISGSNGFTADTPGKFLDPNKSYDPKFDIADAMGALESPAMTPYTRQQKRMSLPLEEVFSRNMSIAVKNSSIPVEMNEDGESQSQEVTTDGARLRQAIVGPLKGVVIAVGKKLTKNQSEYNTLASSLGAEYRWMYDNSCTHFIFQGRQNDVNKEFRVSRDQAKFIVSPHWLTACQEQQCRVDESLFPHTYNPTMSLSITGHKTPARPTRGSVRPTPARPGPSQSTSSFRPVSPLDEDDRSASTVLPPGELTERSTTTATSSEPDEVFEQLNSTQSDEDIAQVCGKVEETERTTNTDAIVDNLKRVMEASKTSSKTRAANRMHSSTESPAESSTESKRSKPSTNGNHDDLEEKGRQPKGRQRSKASSSAIAQPSQVVEVEWDDPVAREQREMLASELQKSSEPMSPPAFLPIKSPVNRSGGTKSTNSARLLDSKSLSELAVSTAANTSGKTSSVPATTDKAGTAGKAEPAAEVPAGTVTRLSTRSSSTNNPPTVNDSASGKRQSAATVTRKPVASASSADAVPAAASAAAPSLDCAQKAAVKVPAPPVFLFSGLSPSEKDDYAALVKRLGGVALDAANYTAQCTHLIVGAPTRNEKYLACVAAGKWVLHQTFLDTAQRDGAFPSEEAFEWGGPGTESYIATKPEHVVKLARAAHRWRLQLGKRNKPDTSGHAAAFDGWRTLLLTDSRREDGFRRLLEAGGAIVLQNKEPSSFNDVTHAFLDLSRYKPPVNLEEMVKAGVNCVKPEYIAIYLTDDPPPLPSVHYIPEVLLFVRCEETRKRKGASMDGDSKRPRPS